MYDARVYLKNYQPGDAVWYLHEQRKECVCTKLQPLYMVLCVVLKKYNDLVYCVQLSKGGPIKVLSKEVVSADGTGHTSVVMPVKSELGRIREPHSC
jgi:hypothetical protein